MNPKGNPETLVAAQPGNANAMKSGVYSARAREERRQQLEAAIASRAPSEVTLEVLTWELSSLLALAELMDESIASGGIETRNGQVRDVVKERRRLNEKIRRTLDELSRAGGGTATHLAASAGDRLDALDAGSPDVLVEYAARAAEESFASVTALTFNPVCFLETVIATADPSVTHRDKIRAVRLLTAVLDVADRDDCVCFTGRSAHDDLEFQNWLNRLAAEGKTALGLDKRLAELVVAAADPDSSESAYPASHQAVKDATAFAFERLRREDWLSRVTSAEPVQPLAHLWTTIVTPMRTPMRYRLDAIRELQRLQAFSCSCGAAASPTPADERDAAISAIVRRIVRRTEPAARTQIAYPETYAALMALVDTRDER